MCGGTPTRWFSALPVSGLSPRVRGNLSRSGRGGRQGGSIPACAGEPQRAEEHGRGGAVYPRVCGGTLPLLRVVPVQGGLSPRVRGNLMVIFHYPSKERSIPACAGEPPNRRCRRRSPGVYPRVCGGTHPRPAPPPSGRGLSPRVRGNPLRRHRRPDRAGSIPACAGEPAGRTRQAAEPVVYPRVCGGTNTMAGAAPLPRGLSPRVRGNLADAANLVASNRSIPACAGEPQCTSARSSRAEVYPRVCGGTCRAVSTGS